MCALSNRHTMFRAKSSQFSLRHARNVGMPNRSAGFYCLIVTPFQLVASRSIELSRFRLTIVGDITSLVYLLQDSLTMTGIYHRATSLA